MFARRPRPWRVPVPCVNCLTHNGRRSRTLRLSPVAVPADAAGRRATPCSWRGEASWPSKSASGSRSARRSSRRAGEPLDRPLRRVAVAAVLKNPYAGAWSENIAELIDAGEWLATELMDRARRRSAARSRRTARAGSSASRASSSTSRRSSTPSSGRRSAAAAGGVSILPSVKKRGAMGAHLDIPVHHIKAMLVRSHFDAMEICVPDAPATDEIARGGGGDERRPAARARRRAQGRGRGGRGRAPLARPARTMRTLITGLGEVVSGRHRARRSPTPTRS